MAVSIFPVKCFAQKRQQMNLPAFSPRYPSMPNVKQGSSAGLNRRRNQTQVYRLQGGRSNPYSNEPINLMNFAKILDII